MGKEIRSLRQLKIDSEVRNFILTNRRWWSFDDAVLMARNPLVHAQKNDKRWRPVLVRALKEAGIIDKNIDKRDLSVFYLYVASYMARRTWWPGHDELWSSLENECYQIARNGLPEGTFEKVIDAICSNLSKKKALVVLFRYGFVNGRIYTSYDGLRKQLPAEYRYKSAYLKVLDQDSLKELRDILPPVFERVNEAHELRSRHYSDEKDMANIRQELLKNYGIKLF